MNTNRKLSRSSFAVRLLGAATLGGATLLLANPASFAPAFANPNTMNTPPPTEPSGESSAPSKKSDEDHHKKRPDVDDLDEFGTFGVPRKPRSNIPSAGTGAGTADDEAAANAAVAAAAAARAAKPPSNIDMPDAMRAERCANNKARIAEIEGVLAEIETKFWSIKAAETRSAQLYEDLPASSAEFALARAEVKELKTALAALGSSADLQSLLAWHKNNLIALGCE